MPGSVVVLCYHGVSATWPVDTAVTPERLEQQLSSFVGRGYRGATFTEAITAPPAPRTLAVTFDDATRSVLNLALPILSTLGLTATVFVPTAFPGTGRPMAWSGQEEWVGTEHEPELACMSWGDLGGLVERGWEIGSHTRSHPHLTTLGEQSLAEELRESRADCERELDIRCRSLAYPYSDYDERVVEAARRAGYEAAGTVPREPAVAKPLQWPRVGVYRRDTAHRVRARIWRRGSMNGSQLARAVDSGIRAVRRVFP